MQLVDYLNILNRRKGIIFVTLIIALSIIAIGITQIPPEYTATATMRILTARAGGVDYVEYDIEYAKRLIGTYVEIANSDLVLEQLAKDVSPLPTIDVTVIEDTELFTISATDTDPEVAKFAANKLAEILILQSREIYGSETNILLLEPAKQPTEPSSASPVVVLALGLVLGLVVGITLAFIFENLDTRIYTPNEMRLAAKLPLIGDIGNSSSDHDILINDHIMGEAFRRLRTNVFAPSQHQEYRSFLITSPVPDDGRSTITANLAIITGQSGRRVIVVDADLRNPMQHKIFKVDNEVGLNDVLIAGTPVEDAIQSTAYQNVDILPSGAAPLNPEALDSAEMKSVISHLSNKYDAVLIDAHSSFSVTDPAVIAPKVDSVLLVLRYGWDRKEVLQATLNHLELVNANIVGIIANRTQLGVNYRLRRCA
ncbi:MAG TPA: polysaccharide biosynthesis tyrosine autokinase [Chloroflexi bacterium]|nr:polysaccharide biosynthesis tyrosine autokinase [Chloroflexota bacterium]